MENTVLFHPITTSEFTFCWIYIVLMLFFLGYVFVSVQIWNSPKNMENMLYAIYISSIASGPFLIIFFLSLFLFFALFLLNLFGRIPVPTCLFVIALIFASIGLFAFAHLQSWQINVKQKSIEIHRLFKRTIHAESSETECCLTDSSKLNIYVDGKKVFKINSLAENSERFFET